MTKQQAHEESIKRREIGDSVSEFRDRAMEIYAAAFAEWVVSEQFVKLHSNTDVWVFDYITSEDTQYTTSELLQEFEKN